MREVDEFLQANATGELLPWSSQLAAVERFGLPHTHVEEAALVLGLLPARYVRNRNAISLQDQLKLFRSRVAVIGCGGIGGYVIEQLARLGVGTIVVVDPDVFEEHNLNRQILSTPGSLGRVKVDMALARVAEVNPAVRVVPICEECTSQNGAQLLEGVHVVVDAVDCIASRLALADTCTKLGVPLVHGAIAGWYGQITTQYPGDNTIQMLYSRWTEGKGAEKHLGNPSFTPALVASLEVTETCKILLGTGKTLRGRKIAINLLDMTFEEVEFARPFGSGD